MISVTPLLVIVGLLCSHCFVKGQTLPRSDWEKDIDYLESTLPQKHPDLFRLTQEETFKKDLAAIKNNLPNLSDLRIALALQRVVAGLGDSHTRVRFSQFINPDKVLPLHLYWFSDGLYVLATTKKNASILGNQIVSVNGVPLAVVADSLCMLVTSENAAMRKTTVPELLPLTEVLQYFGIAQGESIELELKTPDGVLRTITMTPERMSRENRVRFRPESIPLCFQNENGFFIGKPFKEDSIYYIQYNRCWSRELEMQYGDVLKAEKLPSFSDFKNKVLRELDQVRYSKVVFDLRLNEGGNSAQGTELMNEYAVYSSKKGVKTYVIIGRQTFSSAILNVVDLKRLANAVTVGEDTRGKPNHLGEVRDFRLPMSGLRIYTSTKYFNRVRPDVNTLVPDVPVEMSFLQFSKGVDPTFEWIKAQ